MKNFPQKLLYKKWFLFAIFMLLLNDFFLKFQFHNTLTGKISDVAGLFAFSYFLSLFTKKIKIAYYFTFVFFIFWKTEASQPLIDVLNGFNLTIYRVVDYSDFIAFLILPVSYAYRTENSNPRLNRSVLKSCCIAFITCFSFIATTQIPKKPLFPTYEALNLKSDLTLDLPFNEATFFDSLGYKFNKPLFRNNGYYVFIDQRLENYTNLEIVYKITILKSKDSFSRIKVDSVLDFRYTQFPYNGIKDSIKRTQFYEKYKKMSLKQFDSIFLSKFEKPNHQ